MSQNGRSRNVVLVGYRGTGKSSVATRVGAELALTVRGMDAEIIARAGKPVPEIVAERGWSGFRDLESEVCRDFAAGEGQVIDCGGGVIERDDNIEVLRSSGVVFWLRASVDTIVRRISGDTERPSLTGQKSFTDEVAEVLERREPRYRRIAHHEVMTDGRGLEDIAREVSELARAG